MSGHGDGRLPPELGELLQPEAQELEGITSESPAWAGAVASQLEPLPAELARLEARVAGIGARKARWTGTWTRPVWVAFLAMVVAVGAWRVVSGPQAELVPTGSLVVLSPDDGRELALAMRVVGDAVVQVEVRDPRLVEVVQHSGRALYEVDPQRAEQQLLVRAGGVSIRVRGTRFLVERVGDVVEVAVERGSVEVSWASGSTELLAGQRWRSTSVTAPTRVEAESQGAGLAALDGGPGEPLQASSETAVGEGTSPGVGAASSGGTASTEAPQALAPGRERVAEPSTEEAPQGESEEPEVAPGGSSMAESSRLWLELVDGRDRGMAAEDLLVGVDAFLRLHPESPLAPEAELLRLELWARDLDPHAAIAILEQWLSDHPRDPRRPQVLLLHGTVAAGRLDDCPRGRSSLVALAEQETGELRATALAYLAACEAAAP